MKKSPRYYLNLIITTIGSVLIANAIWAGGGPHSLKYILTDFRFYIGIILVLLAYYLPIQSTEKASGHK